jgi:hypothetical protein
MDYYSVGCIDIILEELHPQGGHSWGGERHYDLRNCEWSAHILLRNGYRSAFEPVADVLPRFCDGNRDKFYSDLPRIGPLLSIALAEPGTTVILHAPDSV